MGLLFRVVSVTSLPGALSSYSGLETRSQFSEHSWMDAAECAGNLSEEKVGTERIEK